MEVKKVNRVKGFSNNGVKQAGQTGFEDSYESIEIVDQVKKIGEGENDYVIVKKVIRSYQPIQEVIDADKESVGVYNIIKQVMRTGDTSLLPADKGNCNVDFVGAPETLMELKQVGVNAEKAFKGLPEDLTSGQDLASFVNSMSDERFNAFIEAVKARSYKKEVKENE